jgi:predicted HicB family RNase H-like nuclease
MNVVPTGTAGEIDRGVYYAHNTHINSMGRPRLLQEPSRLNLVLDQPVKDAAIRMAQEKGLSLGQFISQLVQGEAMKSKGKQRSLRS